MTTLDLLAAVVRGDVTVWPEANPENLGNPENPGNPGNLELAFVDAAVAHRVEGLVVWQLRRAGTLDAWPTRIRTTLEEAAHGDLAVEVAREGELRSVISTLAAAGVPCVLMKGAALAYTRYPQPWLRPRLDSDILIRDADAPAADRALTAIGYERTNELVGELVNHQMPYVKHDHLGLQHTVDVHWKISNRPLVSDRLGFDELWEQSIPVPALGDHARAAGDVHALMLACLHRVAHHHGSDHLAWCYDIHLLASRLGPDEWDRFVALARGKQVAAICANGLALAADRLHTALPASVTSGLAVSGEPSELYLDPDAWHGDVRLSDLKTLPGWRAKLRLIREVALPDADYMLREYHASSHALVPALHVRRLARGTWRLLRRFAQ